MQEKEPKRPLSADEKRARVVLLVVAAVIAITALGVGWLALSIGVPFLIAAILTVVIAAVVGLFMFLNMI